MIDFLRNIKPEPQDAFAAIALAMFWFALFTLIERLVV